MALETLPRLLPALIGSYLLLLAPGQACWRGRGSGTPRLFARVGLSLVWTSAAGCALAAAGAFSVPRLVLLNAFVTLFGYLAVVRPSQPDPAPASAPARGTAGLVVVAAALVAFWPPLETHMGASDSSSYLSAGIRLAHTGRLSVPEPELAELSAGEARVLFPSVLRLPWKPPFSRMPGGMVVASREATVVYPSFFPLPSVWAAVFADLFGPRRAGGYAAWFSALALWAAWLLMRRRAPAWLCIAATGMLALNAASYWSARFALSEPIVWFFVWAMLASYDAWEEEGLPRDALLAGAFAGAAVMARAEYAMFLVLGALVRPLAGRMLGPRRLPLSFFVAMILVAAVAWVEASSIHGAYLSPVTDTVEGVAYRLRVSASTSPTGFLAVAAAVLVSLVWSLRRGGWRGLSLWLAAAMLGAYMTLASHCHLGRSLGWIASYTGWLLPALALAGGWTAWRGRLGRPSDGPILLFVSVTALVILYDPHVIPSMPWAARRLVPVVVPAMVVFAVAALGGLAVRSPLATAALTLALAATVLAPARALWGRSFYAGGSTQLARVASSLPEDGIVIFDGRLKNWVLATPLWLVHGRSSFTLDLDLPRKRWFLTGFVRRRPQRRIYLVSPLGNDSVRRPIPFVRRHRLAEVSLQTRLPEQTLGPVPRVAEDHTTTLVVERLEALPAPYWKPAPRAHRPGTAQSARTPSTRAGASPAQAARSR